MAALPTQVLVPGGSASTLTAAAGGGDTATPGDGVFLEVLNSDASSARVTSLTDCAPSGSSSTAGAGEGSRRTIRRP